MIIQLWLLVLQQKNIITITEKQQPQQKAFKVQGQSTVLVLVEEN